MITEQRRKYVREYKMINREKINAQNRDWRRRNIEHCRSWRREWDEKNRENTNARMRLFYKKNRDTLREKSRIFARDNPEKVREMAIKWRRKDPERYKERLRIYNRKSHYGLTDEQFNILLEKQNNSCAICKTPFIEDIKKRGSVDHDHETGKVRGLLCVTCNLGLGAFRDDPMLLESAVGYLKEN